MIPNTTSTLKLANRWVCTIAVLISLNCTIQAGINGSKVAPPTARPYGQSMSEWAKQFFAWLFVGQSAPQQFGHVLFPVAATCSVSGSGTFADPTILDYCAEFTIKTGTAFADPHFTFGYEVYEDGSTDPVPSDAWWNSYGKLTEPVVLDGQTVVTSQQFGQYYVPPQYYDPPVMYPQPTSYGSIGVYAIQGWMLMVEPLAVGVHHLSSAAGILAPADNGYFPFEFGQIIRFSYTITVLP